MRVLVDTDQRTQPCFDVMDQCVRELRSAVKAEGRAAILVDAQSMCGRDMPSQYQAAPPGFEAGHEIPIEPIGGGASVRVWRCTFPRASGSWISEVSRAGLGGWVQ